MFLFSAMSSTAQEWQWKWGVPGDNSRPQIQEIQAIWTDYLNRSAMVYTYNDTLVLPDTNFIHTSLRPYNFNAAIAFYRHDGTFSNAVDISTSADGHIWNTLTRTDKAGNVYIACEFQVQAILNDSVINHGPAPWPETPDIFVAKLGPDNQVLWIRLILATSQSTLDGLEISADQQVYLATSHYANGAANQFVSFFGADSSSYSKSIQCILKITPEGSLEWRKEINTANGSGYGMNFLKGEDENLYHFSSTNGACYVGNDTVPIPPGYKPYSSFQCLMSFTPGGNFLAGKMLENRINIRDIKVDPAGDIFFSGLYWDTAFVANDTLLVGKDSIGSILGKATNNFDIQWFQSVKTKNTFVVPQFQIVPENGDLFFAATFMRTFQFAGQTFQFGNSRKVLIGKLLPGGILGQYFVGESSSEMTALDLAADNCHNLLLSGAFSGTLILGSDTLHGFANSKFVGFLQTHAPIDPALGNDTTVCQHITLHAAKGYPYYKWNHGTAASDSLLADQTGWYSVTVHDDQYCWGTDSVYILVKSPPVRVLGNDTIMYRKDSVFLHPVTPFDHCLWSTGDTTSSILIKGKQLGVGQHTIFITIRTGPCIVTDSIRIDVTWSPGMDDMTGNEIAVYPNPFSDHIMVRLKEGKCQLAVFNPEGKMVCSIVMPEGADNVQKIWFPDLLPGVYILQLITGEDVYYRKLVKS